MPPVLTDALLITSAVTLAVLPLMLLATFLAFGTKSRIKSLRSYFNPDAKAGGAIPSVSRTTKPDVSLADYLVERYKEEHRLRRYALPIVLFHVVYLFSLYWSFVTFESYLFAAEGAQSSLREVAILAAAGAMGGVFVVLWHLFWRTMRIDLQPRAFVHSAGRLVAAPFLGILLAAVPMETENKLFLAFGAGFFAQPALRLFEQRWRDSAGAEDRQEQPLPLRDIEGLLPNDELRLWEEGISDAQHVAVETVEALLVNTNYSLERIIDWKDQAFLYIYVDKDLSKWRALQTRGALDVLGMAPKYYDNHEDLVEALSRSLEQEPEILRRFIDTIYNDPRVHQLWEYLVRAYPASTVQPIVEKLEEVRENHDTDEQGAGAAADEPS